MATVRSLPLPATRPRRLSAALGAVLVATLMTVAPVAAATQTATVDGTIHTGPTDIGTKTYDISPFGNLTVGATAEFSQPVRETLTYDDANIRQGRTVDVARAIATNGAGTLTVRFTVSGFAGAINNTQVVPCTLNLGGAVTCNVESDSIRIFGQVPVPLTPIVDMKLRASVKITAAGTSLDSTVLSGGVTLAGPDAQTVPGTQSVAGPCAAGAGDTLALSDTGASVGSTVAASNGPAIEIGGWVPIPVPPFIIDAGFVTFDVGVHASETFSPDIADPATHLTELGTVLKNNVPPHAASGGDITDQLEGVPVAFDGSGTTALCGPATLRWDFSDGGVAFGPHPFHTFADNGAYSGLLTATDTTGLTSSTTFSVTVGNQNPVVNAGPDGSGAWGRPIAFNGSATDPGAGDQSTLAYSWDFGDGSPPMSATGGASVVHAYTTPGTYVATLTVTDKDGGSSSDTRSVVVRKRNVTVSYLGDTTGTYDTAGTLSASLVDEFGNNVSGRSIAFGVGPTAPGSASTGSSGVASLGFTPLLDAGSYATGAAFDGAVDSLYASASATGSIVIGKKAGTVVYTGALSGGPNKSVTLSAVLKDATGKALAGRRIDFQLGSQNTFANTDTSGVASITLKLTQKNAKYALTATWTPSVTDAGRYTGSSASVTFSLQAK